MAALTALASLALWRAERTADRPLLVVPRSARRRLAAACAVARLMNLCGLGSLLLLTQVVQDIHRLPPPAASLLLLAGLLPLPLLGTTAGRMTHRFGPWRTSALGPAVAAAGSLAIASSVHLASGPALPASLALWGTGVSIVTPAIVTAALQAIPDAPGTASGAGNTARQTAGALGVALFSTLAGSTHAAGFVRHTTWLLAGAGTASTTAAVLCLCFGEPVAQGAERRGARRRGARGGVADARGGAGAG